MASESKFAILIDADNIAEKYVKIILDETTKNGVATYKRIYGDWTNPQLGSWKSVLLDNSMIPIQQYGYTSGKNSTDSAMIIDAMDILYSGNVDGFVLVSSDSDFTRLAARLRESGMVVIGMGENKTPKPFIAACNQFKYLDILFSNAQEEEKEEKESAASEDPSTTAIQVIRERPIYSSDDPHDPMGFGVPIRTRGGSSNRGKGRLQNQNGNASQESQNISSSGSGQGSRSNKFQGQPQPQTDLKSIKKDLRKLVEECSDEDGWIYSGELGNQIAKRFPDFDVRNYGFNKFTPFMESLGIFDVKREQQDGNSKAQLVYFKKKK